MEFVAPFGGECIKFQKALDVEFSVYIMRTSSAAAGFPAMWRGRKFRVVVKNFSKLLDGM
jgi:hypothetical protein